MTAAAAAPEADQRPGRRRIAVGATLAIGVVLLAFAFAQPPGSSTFYLFALAVAAVWAVGGILSGPLPLGPRRTPNGWYLMSAASAAIGVVAAGAVVASVLLGRQEPGLRGFLDDLLARARGPVAPTVLVTLVNGAAEELFFRGAVYAMIGPRRPVIVSTAIYALATAATGNPALVVAAVALGLVFGLQRRISAGILSPALTHVTWSAALLAVLPRLPN